MAKKDRKIEWVSYDGDYPNLCTGKLTVKIGGKVCEFGLNEKYPKFWRSGGHNLDAGGVGLTKAEAWKAEIELVEERIKRKEAEIAEDRECLERYKAELAKAKEEEENESGWTRILHNGKFEIAPCSKKFAYVGWFWKTQSEAFRALAEYYKGEYEEALKKAEKTK